MKKLNKLFYLGLAFSAVFMFSCTKEGPMGPAGTDGINGENGIDGSATCMECHKEDQEIPMKINQFEHSAHFIGGQHPAHFTSSSCTMCHTSQGFQQAALDGTNSGGSHDQVTGMSCYTCHKIHQTYSRDDYGMNYSGEVDFILNETTAFTNVTLDAGEPSNTCVKCHQPRNQGSNQPDITKADTETLTISASSATRYGPHHGTQGAVYGGVGGYLTAAQGTGVKGKHNCVFCHVEGDTKVFRGDDDYSTSMAGGHAFNLSYTAYKSAGVTEEKMYIDRCNECHTASGKSIDIPNIIAMNDVKINGLLDALVNANIANADGSLKAGTYTHKQLAAFWNYKLLAEDLSHGLHNPNYTEKLVASSLAFIGVN